jgi:hypothetical protein
MQRGQFTSFTSEQLAALQTDQIQAIETFDIGG